MLPYLDALVQRLLAMLQPSSPGWVQEQAVTTLAMVADVSEDTFRAVRCDFAGVDSSVYLTLSSTTHPLCH